VEGLSANAAIAVLDAHAIGYRLDYADHSAHEPSSRVSSQTPRAGEQVNRLTGVRLQIVPGLMIATPPPGAAQPPDTRLRQSLVGTWRQIRQFSGLHIDQETTFEPDGQVRLEGHAMVYGQKTPYVLRGDWTIADARLRFRVQTSTVPGVVPPGYVSESHVLAVSADQLAIVDSADGKTYIDSRVQ
jgi:hypothetical protein